MKRLAVLIFSACFLQMSLNSQTIELTFTAIDSAAYVQLDSIKVMNRTQGGDTVLYWPDTSLVLYFVEVPEISKEDNGFRVFQNYPNPLTDQTTISLYVPQKDRVRLIVTDLLGRVTLKSDRVLDRGMHSFQFIPGDGNLFFFTTQWRNQSSSIKILQAEQSSQGKGSLQYLSSEDISPGLKSTAEIQGFTFTPGDELLYIGYYDTLQSGMLYNPEESQTYTFQFAYNIPCPGTPTVEYEGQTYNTVQIMSQCWLKENLNVGTMLDGNDVMEDDGVIEKYCYDNEPDSCTEYGGLYQWNEMMQYTTQQGVQGICPSGWHLPTDEEWKVLEGAVDSQYDIGDPEWDISDYCGFDAGMNLKTTSGWFENSNSTDLFGFSGLPGGFRIINGGFDGVGYRGFWWTSTESDSYDAWGRGLDYFRSDVDRGYFGKEFGFSVRCLRD